jgi:uncharacterized protein YlxW (UPF0749 family)
MMDRVKQKVIMCNQRIANLTEHINNTNAQVSEVNAILREQSQSITMLTGAMPVIQEGVANLRTTIHEKTNDVASKLRATEEIIARTLATLRRESNTAQDVTATEQRESIRQITARIV